MMKKYTPLFILANIFFVGVFVGLMFSFFLFFGWILALLIGFKMSEMSRLNHIELIAFAIGAGVGGLFIWPGLPDLGGAAMAWGITLFLLTGFYSKKIYLYFFPFKSLPK